MHSRTPSARLTPAALASPSPASPPLAPLDLDNTTRKLRWGDTQVHDAGHEGGGQASRLEQGQSGEDEVGETGEVDGGVLAITAHKGRVGCCFYDPVTDKLSVLEDQQDSASWDLASLHALLDLLLQLPAPAAARAPP
ncbi:hypothetical protein JCM8208_000429 [Rhodotorula glutinis]